MFDNELTLLRHTTLALSLWSTAWASSSVLHTFRDVSTGANPNATLAFDPAGNLWGTTLGGGNSDTQHCFNGPNGCGTVFELTPDSGGGWNYHLIYKFTGGPEDGAQPEGPLVFDQTGHVYGTTFRGGTYQNGIVFELTSAPDGSWTEQILYSFQSGPDGANPLAGLTFDASGNLYGTTNGGGTNSNGTIYKLSSNGHGGWTESILYSFLGGTDGLQPRATLVFDSTGTLYGTTSGGGADHAGTVFKLTPSGAVWIETVLHSFSPNAIPTPDGCNPQFGVILDAAGNLYGTAQACGGQGNWGLAYELSPGPGGVWTERHLHRFANNQADGGDLLSPLVLDADGNLYGTTVVGGANSVGTVFKLRRRPNGSFAEIILHNFTGGTDGSEPMAGVTLDPSGDLYTTTFFGGSAPTFSGNGVVFEIHPPR